MSEDLNEEDLIEALAAYERRLRQEAGQWAWWQVAVLFGVGAVALMTQGNGWCAVFAACLAGICGHQPTALRDASLDGYAAGWRRRRDGGRL